MKRTELLLRFLQDKNARRKGLGIEIALLVLLAVFAMSTLLVSTAVLERDGMNSRGDETLERLALDQIGEDFCAGTISFDGGNPCEYNGYKLTLKEPGWMQAATLDGGILKLDVRVEHNKIVQWTYHNLGNGGQ